VVMPKLRLCDAREGGLRQEGLTEEGDEKHQFYEGRRRLGWEAWHRKREEALKALAVS
jgi:hypothetical protein